MIQIKVTRFEDDLRYRAYGIYNGEEIEFDPFTSVSWTWDNRNKYVGKEYLFNGRFVEDNTVFLVYEIIDI